MIPLHCHCNSLAYKAIKTDSINFTQGPIRKQLLRLAAPIVATSFVQMAYNFTDMAWLGRLGSREVAAVGVIGVLLWIATSIAQLTKTSAEVCVSQSLGARNEDQAVRYARHCTSWALIVGTCLALIYLLFGSPIVGIYHLESDVHQMALQYLRIVLVGLPGFFLTLAMSGIYNAHGRSMTPFKVNSLGLLLNMILDPLLIFVLHLGVVGAALATLISQLAVCAILYYRMQHRDKMLEGHAIITKLEGEPSRRIFAIGVPVVLLNSLFALINIFMGRIASEQGGAIGVAVMTTGGQLEGVTWNACQGFCTALAAFVGHNYAAHQFARIWQGYKTTIRITLSIGLFGTLLFLLLGESFFSLIIPDPETYVVGGRYLYIASFSQLFIMAEITTQGLFYGVGRSTTPAVISIVGNLLRIPLVLLLVYTGWGLDAVWWAVSLSSIGKGLTAIMVLLILRKSLLGERLVS